MKITIDFRRVFHLGLLLVGTYGGAKILEEHLELSTMASYGLACFTVCQISNILMKLYGWEETNTQKRTTSSAMLSTERQQQHPRQPLIQHIDLLLPILL